MNVKNSNTIAEKAAAWVNGAWECQHADFDIESFAKHVARLAFVAGYEQAQTDSQSSKKKRSTLE